jgi:hypothetical protein
MNTDFKMPQLQLLLGAALLACASVASAQWMWVDAKGVKQVSDRAPPASIPAKNILKSPGGGAMAPATPAAVKPAGDVKPAASWTEREAAYRKEKAEKARRTKACLPMPPTTKSASPFAARRPRPAPSLTPACACAVRTRYGLAMNSGQSSRRR